MKIKPGLYTHTHWLQCYEVKRKGRGLYLTYLCAVDGNSVTSKIKAHYNYTFLTYIGEV